MKTKSLQIIIMIMILTALVVAQVSGQGQPRNTKSFFYKIDKEHPVAANNALQRTRELLALKGSEELVQFRNETDKYGFRHEGYQMKYKGIPVENGIALVHYQKDGTLQLINGKHQIIPEGIDVVPKVTSAQALERAKQAINAKVYVWELPLNNRLANGANATPLPTLVIYKNRLAYRLDIDAANPKSTSRLYIDASDGTVLDIYSLELHANGKAETRYSKTQDIITTASGNGFALLDYSRGQGILTYNLKHSTNLNDAIDFTDGNNYWAAAEFNNADKDIGALDAHWGLEMTYDYWKTVHKRDSYDGQGSPIISYIHYDNDWKNAQWDPVSKSIHFGDMPTGPWTELDVVSHELGHGLTHSFGISNLYDESSAIHEGLSDVYSACVTNYVNGLALAPAKDVWSWAEETVPGYAARTFNETDTYWSLQWNPEWANSWSPDLDHHSLAQILRYWFYIVSEGGNGTNKNGYTYSVSKQGINVAEQIIYNSLFFAGMPDVAFTDLKSATIIAAQNIYGQNTLQYQAVIEAWKAVGVFDPLNENYCVPGKSASGTPWISNFAFGNMTLFNGNGNNQGFYYDASTSIDIAPGINYPFSASVGNDPGTTKYWKIWIDLDRNGAFDDVNELMYQSSGAMSNIAFIISIPNVPYGNTRMRVGMSLTPINTSCDIVSKGDFKDFRINMLSPSQSSVDGYCIPYGSNSSSEVIKVVKIGSIDESALFPDGGYDVGGLDHNLWISEKYVLRVVPKFLNGVAYDEYYTVWIDLNQNKVFEPNELVNQGHSNGTLVSSLTIPASALTGKTRMRIAMRRGAYSLYPCIPLDFGEYVDVLININPASELTSSDGYCTPRGSCSYGQVTDPHNFNIDHVNIGSLDLNSTNYFSPNDGYKDFTPFVTLALEAGTFQSVNLKAFNPGAYWKLWIDYNKNDLFEANEIAFQNLTASTKEITQGDFQVASNATPGLTRMRLLLSFFQPSSNPCLPVEYGQIIDVLANITPSLYCANFKAVDGSNYYIEKIETSKTANASGPGPYTDFTALFPFVDMLCGSAYKYDLSVTIHSKTGDPAFVIAAIDFDHNGSFTNDEIVVPSTMVTSNQPFALPVFHACNPNMIEGITRFRIVSRKQEFPPNFDFCNDSGTGETEDYTVKIVIAPIPIDKDSDNKTVQSTLSVYPNPAKGLVNWIIPNGNNHLGYELIITDFMGMSIYKEFGTGATGTVDLGRVETGIYVLRINIDDGTSFSGRISVE